MPIMMGVSLTSLIVTSLVIKLTLSADPILSDVNITGFGNTADADDVITWGNYTGNLTYSNTSVTPIDVTIRVYYDMVNAYMKVVVPEDPPYDAIIDMINGDDGIQDVALYSLGFGLCTLAGFLFILIVPLVGCCWCCCRCCCGKCGGQRKWSSKDDEKPRYRCICLSVFVAIATCFLLVGALLVVTTSNDVTNHMITAMPQELSAVSDNLNKFILNTIDEYGHFISENFYFIADVMIRDLDNAAYFLGIASRERIGSQMGIGAAISELEDFVNTFETVVQLITDVDAGITSVTSLHSTLESELSTIRSDIATAQSLVGCSAACAAVDTSTLFADMDPANFPDISTEVAIKDAATVDDFQTNVNEGKEPYDDIPWQVASDTETLRQDIKDTIIDVNVTITDSVDDIGSYVDGVDSLGEVFDDVDLNNYVEFGSIRGWMVGVILVFVYLLTVLIYVFALICGACNYKSDVRPLRRGKLSNSSGNALLCGGCCFFMFSWLIMILVLLLFVMFGGMYGFVCTQLADPTLDVFVKLTDGPDSVLGAVTGVDYLLGSVLFDAGNVSVTLSGMLLGCKNNDAAYPTMRLDAVFPVDDLLDFENDLDLSTELGTLFSNLSSVQLINQVTKDQMRDLVPATDIDYQAFMDELVKDTMLEDPAVYADDMRNSLSGSTPAVTALLVEADNLDVVASSTYADLVDEQAQLLADIQMLNATVLEFHTIVEDIIAIVETAETNIPLVADASFETERLAYQSRILGVVDDYIDKLLLAVNNETGLCRPVYDLYDVILVQVMCENLVLGISGIWFGLGWCIFFSLLTTILGIKLAKHFHTMTQCDVYEDGDIIPTESTRTGRFGKNKVDRTYNTAGVPRPVAGFSPYQRQRVGHSDI